MRAADDRDQSAPRQDATGTIAHRQTGLTPVRENLALVFAARHGVERVRQLDVDVAGSRSHRLAIRRAVRVSDHAQRQEFVPPDRSPRSPIHRITTSEAERVQSGNVGTDSNSEMAPLNPDDDPSRQSRSPGEIFLAPPAVHSGRRDIGAEPGYETLDRGGCCVGPEVTWNSRHLRVDEYLIRYFKTIKVLYKVLLRNAIDQTARRRPLTRPAPPLHTLDRPPVRIARVKHPHTIPRRPGLVDAHRPRGRNRPTRDESVVRHHRPRETPRAYARADAAPARAAPCGGARYSTSSSHPPPGRSRSAAMIRAPGKPVTSATSSPLFSERSRTTAPSTAS